MTDPWALHIGGRWTPFTWIGAGKLTTKSGAEYPLFVFFYLDNPAKARGSLEPSSPVQGMAWLCTAPVVAQVLQGDGGLDGAWVRSTEGRSMGLNLLERPVTLVAPPPKEGRSTCRALGTGLTCAWKASQLSSVPACESNPALQLLPGDPSGRPVRCVPARFRQNEPKVVSGIGVTSRLRTSHYLRFDPTRAFSGRQHALPVAASSAAPSI